VRLDNEEGRKIFRGITRCGEEGGENLGAGVQGGCGKKPEAAYG